MIDTIRLAYPSSPYLISFFEKHSERLQKLSADGEIEWERSFCQKSLPSSFGGLRVMIQRASESPSFVKLRDLILFEFSLQKWSSDTGYNESNTSLEDDLLALDGWIGLLSHEVGYDFKTSLFDVQRVDFSTNYILKKGSVPDYLRSLELKFSRHENGEKKLMRFDGAVQYGSSWIGKKLYHKFAEFISSKGYRKKHKALYDKLAEGVPMNEIRILNGGKRLLNENEISSLARTLRFEVEFRRKFLAKANLTKIVDLPKLLERFDEEKKHYLTVKKITEGANLSSSEFQVVELCKRLGPTGAKQEFLKTKNPATWYRIKKRLQAKDIYIESIINSDWRLDVETADNCLDFELEEIPCVSYAPVAS